MRIRSSVEVSVSEKLGKLAPAVRATVEAARRAVKAIAPGAIEVAYRGQAARSKNAMWKLARYVVDDQRGYVVAIGAFSDHASLFFPRGRELDDRTGLLEGTGKPFRFVTLRSPADVKRAALTRTVRRAFRLTTQT